MVDIDADAPENADVKPELEPGEFIDVFLVPFEGLHRSLVVSLCHPNLVVCLPLWFCSVNMVFI